MKMRERIENLKIDLNDFRIYREYRKGAINNSDYYLKSLSTEDFDNIFIFAMSIKDVEMLKRTLKWLKDDKRKYEAIRAIYYLKGYKDKKFLHSLNDYEEDMKELCIYLAHDHKIRFIKANFDIFSESLRRNIINIFYKYDNKFDDKFIKKYFKDFIGEAFMYDDKEHSCYLLQLALTEPEKYASEIEFLKQHLYNLGVNVKITQTNKNDVAKADETEAKQKKQEKETVKVKNKETKSSVLESLKQLNLMNKIKGLGGNIMGVFNNIPFSKGYLKLLLVTKDYKKIAELIESDQIKITELNKENMFDFVEYAANNSLFSLINKVFADLDDKTKASVVCYFYDNNFAITKELIGENLDLFIDVCINKQYNEYFNFLASLANEEQLKKLKGYLFSLDVTEETYKLFTSPTMICSETKDKLMNSKLNSKYYNSLPVEERNQAIATYIRFVPDFESFKNFVAATNSAKEMLEAITNSDLKAKLKADYLLELLEVAEELKNTIIDILIKTNNSAIISKMISKYLVVDGKIENYNLFSRYLETIPSLESFKELLSKCQEYETMYNYVMDANMLEQARNKYLYQLLEVLDNKEIKSSIVEKLLTSEDQLVIARLVNNYLVVDGKIASDRLLEVYLELKPNDKTFISFLNKVQNHESVYKVIKNANINEQLRNRYLYLLLEIANYEIKMAIIKDLLEVNGASLKAKLANNYLVIDGKISNDKLLKIYLENKPKAEDFSAFLNSVGEYESIYITICEANLSEKDRNSYLYQLLEVADYVLKLTIIEDLLSSTAQTIKVKLANNYLVLNDKITSEELLKIYLENKPTLEGFKLFLDSIVEYATVYKIVMDANITDEEKSEYLYMLIGYYDINTIVNTLLKINNGATITKLINNHLVSLIIEKQSSSKELLKVYLESKPEESNFTKFLNSINNYELIYQTILEVNLTEEAKNSYLYLLLEVANYEVKLVILEELLKSNDQSLKTKLATNYLVLNGQITSEELLQTYLENKPTEENFKNFLNSISDYEKVYSIVTKVNLSEKTKNDYLYQLLEVANYEVKLVILEDLLTSPDQSLKTKLATNYLVLNGQITSEELLQTYLENKPTEENFKNFLNSIKEYEMVYNIIMIANLTEEARNSYLYYLLAIANEEIKLTIIKYLLTREDQSLKLKLATNYLVINGQITSEELLKIYLENKPEENNYNAFLNSISDYEKVYNIIMSATLTNEEKSKYLYMLINYYDMTKVIETLLQIHNIATINKLIRNYLVVDGQITSVKLLILYLETKVPVIEFKAVFAKVIEFSPVVKGILATNLSAEEKSAYLELLLEMETDLKAEYVQNLILDFNVPSFVAKITNDVIEKKTAEERQALLRQYLLINPTYEDLRIFLENHKLYAATYAALTECKEMFDAKVMSEYLYAILDLSDDETLSFSLVNDILALNDIDVIRKMMFKMGDEFQAIYVKQAIKDKNVNLMVTLACTTDCRSTAPLVNRIINLKNPNLIAQMLYNLAGNYAPVALGALINDADLYVKVLEVIKAQEDERVQNQEEPTNLLTVCVRYVFETGMDVLFDSDIIAAMQEMIDKNSQALN